MKNEMDRREFLRLGSAGLAGLLVPNWAKAGSELLVPEEYLEQSGLNIIDHPSPHRKTRATRKSTDYFLLHTTEAPSRNSLNSLARYGEANYMVDTNGDVYRIMLHNQISMGAGRSMWDGRTNLDNHAINIEFVGYHNKSPTSKQLSSGKELIRQLKGLHRNVGNQDMMPHSMVAYGAPNKWHRRSHRGRKRCGMLFANEDVRDALGIGSAPTSDPDVTQGRLAVADSYLQKILYGTERNITRQVEQEVITPAEISEEPERVISTIGKGESVWRYAGDEYASPTTIYFMNNGMVRRGDELRRQGFNFNSIQEGTRVATGYTYGGHINGNRSAYSVVGNDWNLPSTFYRLPNGEIKSGDEIDAKTIPSGTLVLFRR